MHGREITITKDVIHSAKIINSKQITTGDGSGDRTREM